MQTSVKLENFRPHFLEGIVVYRLLLILWAIRPHSVVQRVDSLLHWISCYPEDEISRKTLMYSSHMNLVPIKGKSMAITCLCRNLAKSIQFRLMRWIVAYPVNKLSYPIFEQLGPVLLHVIWFLCQSFRCHLGEEGPFEGVGSFCRSSLFFIICYHVIHVLARRDEVPANSSYCL